MATTQTVTKAWKSGSQAISKSKDLTDAAELKVDITIATAITDQLTPLAISATKTTVLYLVSDVDLTLKTNNSGTPQETIALTAGNPLVWDSTAYHAIPFAGDVTAIYLTNASGQQGNVNVRVLYHP
ncbi:MAG: hypothetical protein ABI353_11440 [Isosphaeraceae bacterium]